MKKTKFLTRYKLLNVTEENLNISYQGNKYPQRTNLGLGGLTAKFDKIFKDSISVLQKFF